MVTLFLLLLFKIQTSLCQLTCDPGKDCTVNCDTPNKCSSLTIDCIDGYNCNFICNALDACNGLKINCNQAINCQLTCDGTATDRPCASAIINGQNAGTVTLLSKCGGLTDNTQCAASATINCPQNPVGSGTCNVNCETGTSCEGIALFGHFTGTVSLTVKGQTTTVDNMLNVGLHCPQTTKNCYIYADTGGLALNGLQINTANPSDFSHFNIQCVGGGTCFANDKVYLDCGTPTCYVDPVTLNSCDGSKLATACDEPMTYALGPDSRTWANAEAYCVNNYPGGHLASVRGDVEFAALQAAANGARVWIGLNDLQSEGTWVWSDGTQCVNNDCKTYTYWSSSEPDQGIEENCATHQDSNTYWQDDDCSASTGSSEQFVCNTRERTPTPATSNPTTFIPTASPITVQPTTTQPTTVNPTTSVPTTITPTTNAPITSNPTTAQPTTFNPTTATPTTSVPTTFNPTTINPTTFGPTTSTPTTANPTTFGPTTAPTTANPTTVEPTTSQPTTNMPTTITPTTNAPTTANPTTNMPTTNTPTTAEPTTSQPTTYNPTTKSPTTSAPTTSAPVIMTTNSKDKTDLTISFEIDEDVNEEDINDLIIESLTAYDDVKIISTEINQGKVEVVIQLEGEVKEDDIENLIEDQLEDEYGKDIDVNVKNNDSFNNENDNFFDQNFFVILMALIIGILYIIVCILCIIYIRKKKRLQNKPENDMNRLSSLSHNINQGDTMDVNATSPMSTTEMVGTNTASNGVGGGGKGECNDPYSDSNALHMWLHNVGLTEYYQLFIDQGFGDKMSALSTLTEDDLKEIGITKMAHRKVIIEQIQRNKHYVSDFKSNNFEGGYGNNMQQQQHNGEFENDNENEDTPNDNDNEDEDLFMPSDNITETKGNNITPNGMNDNDSNDNLDGEDDDEDDALYEKGSVITSGQ